MGISLVEVASRNGLKWPRTAQPGTTRDQTPSGLGKPLVRPPRGGMRITPEYRRQPASVTNKSPKLLSAKPHFISKLTAPSIPEFNNFKMKLVFWLGNIERVINADLSTTSTYSSLTELTGLQWNNHAPKYTQQAKSKRQTHQPATWGSHDGPFVHAKRDLKPMAFRQQEQELHAHRREALKEWRVDLSNKGVYLPLANQNQRS